jgi:CheY-like chemotaxis protein/HPt (histidine-containing phosphotransfer) domain-containing protein
MIRESSPEAPCPSSLSQTRASIAGVLANHSAVALAAHLSVGIVALGALAAGNSGAATLTLYVLTTAAMGVPRLRAARSLLRLHPGEPDLWARAYRAGALFASLGISVGTALLVALIGFDSAPWLVPLALAGLGVAGVLLVRTDLALFALLELSLKLDAELAPAAAPQEAAPRPSTSPTPKAPEVPTGSAPRDLAEVAAPPASEVISVRRPGNVLIAEDVRANQVLLSAFLRKTGATVALADDGVIAVDAALAAVGEGHAFDVILMDMQMPRLDGYGATAKLRSEGYAGAIVAVTAHGMDGDREKCLAAGCDDYLTKPIDRRALIATVERLVARSRPRAPFERATPDAPASRKIQLFSDLAGDPDMEGILAEFLETLGGRAAALQGALAEMDVVTIKRLAHQLKGVAGSYGFPSITAQAKVVEDSLAAGDDPRIVSAVDELCTLCLRARDGAELARSGAA